MSFAQWRWAQGQGNAASCVLRIEAGGESLLLTGDLDEQAEAAFVAAHPGLAVDWLLAPHHGSRTSSSWRLLKALRPSAILLSRGRYNPFGHPHPEVLARWNSPHRGLLEPVDFIEICETSGLIATLSMNVMRKALIEARDWPAELKIAVKALTHTEDKSLAVEILEQHRRRERPEVAPRPQHGRGISLGM